MLNAVYTIIIEPLVLLIETFYMVLYRLFNSGVALIGLSVIVSLLTYPFYAAGERWQRRERLLQHKMARTIQKIKAVFSGDERYMVLAAYYRQNRYHPAYALRKSIGLFLQVPFFIAAYTYLSHLEVLNGASFLFIKNLGAPDALLPLPGGEGTARLNALPLLMTLINAASTAVYTALSVPKNGGGGGGSSRSALIKDALPLYGMAALFLMLLYNSPSGLVLYWTCGNLFSLIKNIAAQSALPKARKQAIAAVVISVCAAAVGLYALFVFKKGYYIKRAALAVCFFSIIFFFLSRFLSAFFAKRRAETCAMPSCVRYFAAAAFILTALAGAAIPSALIASSVEEFSFQNPAASPFEFIAAPALQAAGFFLFWPACIYVLFSKKTKQRITVLITAAAFATLANAYLLSGNYGFLSVTLSLSAPVFTQTPLAALAAVFALCAAAALSLFLFRRQKSLLFSLEIILAAAVTLFSIVNLVKIQKGVLSYTRSSAKSARDIKPVFSFSREGENVIVIMLDRAVSVFVPALFDEKPELENGFSGFVWYPDCASFGPLTLTGAPPLYGGYEYTPKKFGANTGVLLKEKHNQALLVMPRLFSEHGFRVTVTDPAWANYNYKSDISIFDAYPAIRADKIIGKYTKYWMDIHPDIQMVDTASFLKYNLLRFSLLKMAPPFLRFFIYDDGKWLAKITAQTGVDTLMLDEYIALDMLPAISAVENSHENTFTLITNQLTHEPDFLQAPDYTPARTVTNRGNGPFRNKKEYHVSMAAFLLLSHFFQYLQERGVYDNTRIIIVSDHGWNYSLALDKNIKLPNGEGLVAYNPLLLVKDFGARGPLRADTQFMTNADTPWLAAQKLIPGARNPWTGAPLAPEKEDVFIHTSRLWSPDLHGKYALRAAENRYLSVHDSIFDPKNWRAVPATP
jgi:YidC/Oxa1 family membrane protein insertase